MKKNYAKIFLKWFLWLILLIIGIMFVYWFSDNLKIFNEIKDSSYTEVSNEMVLLKDYGFVKWSPISIFYIIIGVMLLIYSFIYLINEISKKYNFKITKKNQSDSNKQ